MRVLMVVRPDAESRPGGDIVHAARAAAALEALGVETETSSRLTPDARGFDVAHVFGVFEPATQRQQIQALRAADVPLVISAIWLDLRAFFAGAPLLERALSAHAAGAVERRLARLPADEQRRSYSGAVARAAERRLKEQREMLVAADVVLAASEVEAYLYGERLHITSLPIVVAPLGIDGEAFSAERPAVRTGLLCAGRIEAKKNQAALLYALRDVDIPVTIVGHAYDRGYLALCKRWASPQTRFVDHVSHAELFALMAGSAVHAMPSWFESPGLSSLEAAATGARIVTGSRGCEREYFGPEIDYADPADPESIRDAVLRAVARGPRGRDDALERRLRAFTWKRHAELTIDAYVRATTRPW